MHLSDVSGFWKQSASGPIYETISGRPSSRSSTYSAASGVSSLYSASNFYPALNRAKQQTDGLKKVKEDEVDHLTDLLVQSMKIENSNDPEFFGICFTCGHKIRGEGNGCSAMGQMYHTKCFTCKTCHKELQGLPFYNVDGKALCEKDYMVRERLSACRKHSHLRTRHEFCHAWNFLNACLASLH